MNFRLLSEYFNNNYNKPQMLIHRKLNLQKEISKNYSKSINMIDDLINQFKSIINKLEYISEENLNFIRTLIYENRDIFNICSELVYFDFKYLWSEKKYKAKCLIKFNIVRRLKKIIRIISFHKFEYLCENENKNLIDENELVNKVIESLKIFNNSSLNSFYETENYKEITNENVKTKINKFIEHYKITEKNYFECFSNEENNKQICLMRMNADIKEFIESLYSLKRPLEIFYLKLDEEEWNRSSRDEVARLENEKYKNRNNNTNN
jgi:hypothetical protein